MNAHRSGSDDPGPAPPQGVGDPRDGQEGSDGDDGVRRADHHGIGVEQGVEDAGSGRAPFGPLEADGLDGDGVLTAHEVLLEGDLRSAEQCHPGANGIVGHGKQPGADTDGGRDLLRDEGQRRPVGQRRQHVFQHRRRENFSLPRG